jgi:molecular chaperone HscB
LSSSELPASPFAVLGLHPGYFLDEGDLRRRLLRFSRLVHPDYFATGTVEVRERAERATAALNDAYELLVDPVQRADWLIRDRGGPSEREERAMPQSFLLEVLAWNEALEAARETVAGSRERQELDALGRELAARRGNALADVARFLGEPTGPAGADLRSARQALNAVRYLDRSLGEIRELSLGFSAPR